MHGAVTSRAYPLADQTFELPEVRCFSELIGQAVPLKGRLEPK